MRRKLTMGRGNERRGKGKKKKQKKTFSKLSTSLGQNPLRGWQFLGGWLEVLSLKKSGYYIFPLLESWDFRVLSSSDICPLSCPKC